jgi:hypothetical protein
MTGGDENLTLFCEVSSHLLAVTSLNAFSRADALYFGHLTMPIFLCDTIRGLPKIEWLILSYSRKQSQTGIRNRPSIIAISLLHCERSYVVRM